MTAPSPGPAAPWDGSWLDIAFWNIEYWPGGMFERRLEPPAAESVANQLEAVRSILNREVPDILLASEIHGLSAASFLNEHLARSYPHVAATAYTMANTDCEAIAPFEDLRFRRKPERVTAGRRHEHAIFSRLPWTSIHEVEVDDRQDEFQPRGFMVARFEAGAKPLWIYAVHPNTGERWRPYREALPALLVREMTERGLDPGRDRIVVLGDFNLDWFTDSQVHFEPLHEAGFLNTLAELDAMERITKPTTEGGSTIDYIFVSRPLKNLLEPGRAVVVADSAGHHPDERAGRDAGIASDHRMVRIRLRLD